MYIIFLWIVRIQWGFVIRQGMHVAKKDLRFDITDHASNQVKLCVPTKLSWTNCSNFLFLFLSPQSYPPILVCLICFSWCLIPQKPTRPSPSTQYRLVPRGIFGSRAISNVVSLLDRAIQLKMNSRIFKRILHVVQVSLFQGVLGNNAH